MIDPSLVSLSFTLIHVISGWRLGSVQSKMSDTDLWWGERNSAVDGSRIAERQQQPCFREGLCFSLISLNG